jgi:metal-responsive CopG/Arc/MetJ family transcriptional regulator
METRKGGRPKKPYYRKPYSLYLTDAEIAAIDTVVQGARERSEWIREAIREKLARAGKRETSA